MKLQGEFRFTYFTDKYTETCEFYKKELEFELEHSWDRNEHDKGALFKCGVGFIEVLLRPSNEKYQYPALDYRPPQGVFVCIEVSGVDEFFHHLKSKDLNFQQEITNQPWGHRSFSLIEPNGLLLFFFQEQ